MNQDFPPCLAELLEKERQLMVEAYARGYEKGYQAGRLVAVDAPDVLRLDFMLREQCVLTSQSGRGAAPLYRLYWSHLDMLQPEWYPNPRAAIDAAMATTKPDDQL